MISLVSTLKNKCPLVFSTIILGLLTTASFAQVKKGYSPSSDIALASSFPVVIFSHNSPNRLTSHSPLNPAKRFLPVKSCCMVACLMPCFLAMSLSNSPINASMSDRAVAMAVCSFSWGIGMLIFQ